MTSWHQANFTGVTPLGQLFYIVHAVVPVAWAVVWWEVLCSLVPAVDSCVTPGQSSSIWGFDYNTYKRKRLDMQSAGSWHVFLLILSYRLCCRHRNLIIFAGWLKGAVLSGIWEIIPWIRLRTGSFWTKFQFGMSQVSQIFFLWDSEKRNPPSLLFHHSTVSRAHSLLVFMCRRHLDLFFKHHCKVMLRGCFQCRGDHHLVWCRGAGECLFLFLSLSVYQDLFFSPVK